MLISVASLLRLPARCLDCAETMYQNPINCVPFYLQELLQARLADATKLNDEAQERQHARLKEVARRWAAPAAAPTQPQTLDSRA